jgi:hypothetical protein
MVAFEPAVVRPGESCTYRVVVNALEASIEWPVQLNVPPKWQVREGGRGQYMGLAASVWQPHTTFLYHIYASEPGQFTLPEFTVVVYGKPVTIPAAHLDVVPAPPEPSPPVQRLFFDLPGTNLFVGEAARVRVILPALSNGPVQPLGQVQINGRGFLVDQSSARPRAEILPRLAGRSNVMAFIYETILTPIATGQLSAFAQGYTVVGRRLSGNIAMPGSPTAPMLQPSYTLLDSEPVEFKARALPLESQLPGFTGAVGSYTVEAAELATNILRVGEPVKLTVRVRGGANSNPGRLVAPPPPQVQEWQVLSLAADSLPAQLVQAQGFVTLQYTLIPLVENARGTPVIPFSCFDPEQAVFKNLSIPSIPVTVQPGSAAANIQALRQAQAADAETEKEPALNGLATSPGWTAASLVPIQRQAWFPLMQLAPAAAFLGLWAWDRRRRFLEQHPEVVRRRRARRGLRREWRALERAARARDGRRFTGAAVNAMRAACAPHYPAEPQALVGSDVLLVLPEAERRGPSGEVVRRFFAVSDAVRFAASPADERDLLELKPELERVLHGLEERL